MIRPVNLPTGAGLNFGGGDVRHFSEGDEVGVPAVSNPTRHLAERDNLLAEKVNEVVSAVNNKEQFVPLPVLRTTVPPLEEIVVTNYRIPEGFEVRVINASIASAPSSTNTELNIFYATGFGNSSGAAVVTTALEFTSGTSYYQSGEFIVSIKNKGASTLDIVASILLTMRPIGSVGSILVGSVVRGDKGSPGQQGVPGKEGRPGTGGAGSPGMVWRGPWMARPEGFTFRDVVSFDGSGTLSSFFCKVGHAPSSTTNAPPNSTYWDFVARGALAVDSVTVLESIGTVVPNYQSHTVDGTLITGSNWVPLAIDGYNLRSTAGVNSSAFTANGTYRVSLREAFVESDQANLGFSRGLAFLTGAMRLAYAGDLKLVLPKQVYGAKVDYTANYVAATVAVHGTIPNLTSFGTLLTAVPMPVPDTEGDPVFTDVISINVQNASPLWSQTTIFGVQPY